MKVGVVIQSGIDKKSGGGHSYYQKIIDVIQNHKFENGISICYVNFTKTKFDGTDVLNLYHEMSFIFKIGLFPIKLINKFFEIIFKYRYFNNFIIKVTHIRFENILKNRGISILYYPTPVGDVLNFPYIVTCWDLGHKSSYAFPELSLNGVYSKRNLYYENLYNNAFSIIVESEEGKKQMQYYMRINPDRIFVLPMFAGFISEMTVTNDIENDLLKKNQLKRGEFYFYPAQFWGHKNHIVLLKAFMRYLKLFPNTKLVLTGSDKGNLNHIQNFIQENNLSNHVFCLGFVSDEFLLTLYKNALALVYPSFLGPTNIPLLDAALLKCKVICSNLPGHIEQLGDYALYFNPRSHTELFNKMLENNSHSNLNSRMDVTYNIGNKLNQIFDEISKFRGAFGNDLNIF